MGAITFSLDPALLHTVCTLADFEIFVETGTYEGDTVALARAYFATVLSLEDDVTLAQAAAARFAADAQVTVIQGCSAVRLAELQPQLQARRVLYWLDAHWCAGANGTTAAAPPAAPCPLLDELRAIRQLHPESVILIDDARLLIAPPVAPHPVAGWPRFHAILAALQQLSPEHRLLICNDVLIFYPPALEEGLFAFAHQHGVDWLQLHHNAVKSNHLLQETVEKEAVIQQIRHYQHTSPLYWARRLWLHTVLRNKTLVQYAPRPLRLPAHYAHTPLRTPKPPTIAIVTPSYQQGAYLARTIDSVLAQGYPTLEYVIQDGGSTDATTAILDQYRARLTHVTSQRDAGQADAINQGFRQTTGEIMAWLNSDDCLLPGALATVGDFFAAHPEVDVVYGHRIQINQADQEVGRWVLPPHDSQVLTWADYIPQETLFWRRRLWEKVGGAVDTSYHFALDWELLLRFRQAGANFVRLPRFLAAFRIHDEQKTSNQLRLTGYHEMQRLRTQVHGRCVSQLEIHAHITGYLLRAAVLDRLMAWGVVRC